MLPRILGNISKVLEFRRVSGLPLNTTKCEVVFVNATEEENVLIFTRIKQVDESSLEILGSPDRPREYVLL